LIAISDGRDRYSWPDGLEESLTRRCFATVMPHLYEIGRERRMVGHQLRLGARQE